MPGCSEGDGEDEEDEDEVGEDEEEKVDAGEDEEKVDEEVSVVVSDVVEGGSDSSRCCR